MANGIGIGELFGIAIELDWTFVLLLLFVLFLGYFTIVVILFTMVLLHELGHSLTARHYNVRVKKIILFPLGGASVIDLEDLNPDISFKIAAAGPIVSVLLTVVFGALYIYHPAGAIGGALEILFLLNGLLAISNFIPAFPLDGGRVLKSYLEKRHSKLDATTITVKVSKIILAIYVIASTIYAIVYYGSDISTFFLLILWNMIIAIFIWGGAQAELESVYIAKYTEKLHVYNLLSQDFMVVKPNTTIRQLYGILLKQGVKTILFKEGDRVKMVTRITARALSRNPGAPAARISSFSDEIPTIDYKASLSRAISRMRYEESGIVAVMKDGKIAGIILADRIEALTALRAHHMRAEGGRKGV